MRRFWWVVLLVGCAKSGVAVQSPVVAQPAVDAVVVSPVVGTWSGPLATPMGPMPLVLHIRQDGERLVTTVDSPSQGSLGIPTVSTTLTGATLVVDVSGIGARFEGQVGDRRIDGVWTQNGHAMSLALTPGTAGSAEPLRPQTPKAPFPYAIEDVRIASADGVTLACTMTTPVGDAPAPAIVLLSGSGPQDRDETLAGHRPFWVLADHLSRDGVAVLRCDDRGVGASTGDFAASGLPQFALDAAAALVWLDARPETGRVGYLGHSEGGYVASMAQRQKKADFLVLLAGPSVAGGEVLEEQGALLMAAAGASQDLIDRGRARTHAVVDLLLGDEVGPVLRQEISAALGADGDVPAQAIAQLVDVYVQPWFRAFVRYDPASDLAAIGVPTLAVFGELDLQVPPGQSREPMERALGETGEVVVLDGLNHLFQPAVTGNVTEYAQIETTLDPSLLSVLSAWIRRVREAPYPGR